MGEKVLVRKLVEKYDAGDIICSEGDEGHDMYIVKSGKVEVLKQMGGELMVLATLGPKEFVGEMALFGVERRSATVRAVVPSEVIIVTKKMLETQFMKVPDWLVSMIKTIASRIISTTKGVKAPYKISMDFSLLKSIMLICNSFGTSTRKGYSIPAQVLRDELKYTLGVSYGEVDACLKRFSLVNLIKILGGEGLIEVPDSERLKLLLDYLYANSPEGEKTKLEIDAATVQSFDRIIKLLQH